MKKKEDAGDEDMRERERERGEGRKQKIEAWM